MGKRSKAHGVASEQEKKSDEIINKKIKFEDTDDDKSEADKLVTPSKKGKTKNKNKLQRKNVDYAQKSKKIIFSNNDEEPVEGKNTTVLEEVENKLRSTSSNKSAVQENEEDIKDEDIDKFCDEINEEDNEQYEDWVKLIEAKLNSNKKKSK